MKPGPEHVLLRECFFHLILHFPEFSGNGANLLI